VKAKRLVDRLVIEYGGLLNPYEVCEREKIGVTIASMINGADGIYVKSGKRNCIILSKDVSPCSRDLVLWHELYHHFYPLPRIFPISLIDGYEIRADIFGVLASCPHITPDCTLDSISSSYGVSQAVAIMRLNLGTMQRCTELKPLLIHQNVSDEESYYRVSV
jgi:hypothetical protein